MEDLPTRPDINHPSSQEPGHAGADGGPRRGALAWIALAIGVVVIIVVLHLTGVVGPGSR